MAGAAPGAVSPMIGGRSPHRECCPGMEQSQHGHDASRICGICVSDLERSLRFYCEALGFGAAESHVVGDEFGRLMELEGVSLRSQFVRREALAIELLAVQLPGGYR